MKLSSGEITCSNCRCHSPSRRDASGLRADTPRQTGPTSIVISMVCAMKDGQSFPLQSSLFRLRR
ncbi:MAG: CxxxxCH/CxxCH domain-containing protein [Nocardioidaceae bacterium]|nr:CxxxxCH/CxxCH domain-containing protein [Nocardioidaceae bacterium]